MIIESMDELGPAASLISQGKSLISANVKKSVGQSMLHEESV